jgi:hypothetical protein
MGTVHTFNAISVRRPVAPLGARIAGDLFSRFTNWMSTPAALRKLSRTEEAAQVREMAYQVRDSDPGFSADLYGAAARHEALDD